MKVCIQAGHKGVKTGATGAPGEQEFNSIMTDKVANLLRGNDIEVTTVSANPNNSTIAGDWDLFLAIHYDADIYNDRGGFIDTPDPSTDFATKKSNAIAEAMRSVYFSTTGIPERKSRSNANTKYYYMWRRMSANTPCVIIECGVGWRKPEDNNTLWNKQDLVAGAIANGVLKGLNKKPMTNQINQSKELTACLNAHTKLVDELTAVKKEYSEYKIRMQANLEELQEDRDAKVLELKKLKDEFMALKRPLSQLLGTTQVTSQMLSGVERLRDKVEAAEKKNELTTNDKIVLNQERLDLEGEVAKLNQRLASHKLEDQPAEVVALILLGKFLNFIKTLSIFK